MRLIALVLVLLACLGMAAPAALAAARAPAPSGSPGANVVFTVTGSPHASPGPPSSSPPGGGVGGTAFTGAAIALCVSTGVLLVFAGVAMVVVARHRGRRAACRSLV